LAAAGAQLRIVSRLADYRSVLTLAAAGLGCGLVPRLAVEADLEACAKGRLRMLTLEDQPPRLIGLAWNRDRRPSDVVDRFIGFAVDAGDRGPVPT
jgi:DNA-binding transcriptional LysR family regulator